MKKDGNCTAKHSASSYRHMASIGYWIIHTCWYGCRCPKFIHNIFFLFFHKTKNFQTFFIICIRYLHIIFVCTKKKFLLFFKKLFPTFLCFYYLFFLFFFSNIRIGISSLCNFVDFKIRQIWPKSSLIFIQRNIYQLFCIVID